MIKKMFHIDIILKESEENIYIYNKKSYLFTNLDQPFDEKAN